MSSDPISDVAEGATKGALEWSFEKIKQWVTKFKQGELSFIEDQETIDLVRHQRTKPEWLVSTKYIKDRDLKLQVEMGFALRKLEDSPQKLQNLRDIIRKKYGSKGLHISQAVQNGILGKYLSLLIQKTDDEKTLQDQLESMLSEIEKYVLFVKKEDNANEKAEEILVRIRANLPPAFLIFSSGKATDIASDAVSEIRNKIKSYDYEITADTASEKLYQFLIKKS